jgi:hypothetical protein
MVRLINATGDEDVIKSHSEIYRNSMLVLRHYFAQEGAWGIIEDMKQFSFSFEFNSLGISSCSTLRHGGLSRAKVWQQNEQTAIG